MKKKTDNDNKKDKKRIIVYIGIIIIIILSLITSCSCTSNFFGKIGNIFKNEKDYTIDKDAGDKETIRNEDLRFDKDNIEISLSDTQSKISFSYKNINPTQFTCSTSDASIATCYVSNGYVVINSKNIGEVIVTLQTITNGKIYEATTLVKIDDVNRYIELSSYKGTINLANSSTRSISYKLVGIAGDIKAVSSNENIATVTINGNKILITGKSVGEAVITVTVDYNGRTYEKLYTVNITNSKDQTPSKPTNPTNPTEPDTPAKPEEPKDNDTSLKLLRVDGKSILTSYYVEVTSSNVKLSARPKKSTSVIIYNDKEYKSLNEISLDLKMGENTIKFKVKAEDNTTKEYTISIIRKDSGGSTTSYNKNLEYIKINNQTIPNFNPYTYNYTVYVDGDSKLEAKAEENNATIYINDVKKESIAIKGLKPGETQTVTIKVQGPDGTFKNYTVEVVKKSAYTLKVEDTKCDILGEEPVCFAKYTIYKNGQATDLVATSANLTDNSYGSVSISQDNPGELVITPNIRNVFKNIKELKVNVGYNSPEGSSTPPAQGTITLNYLYQVTGEPNYDMGVSGPDNNLYGERIIILNTNLFSGTDFTINGQNLKNYNGKETDKLEICSKNNCVILNVANGPIKIAYVKEDKVSDTSLAIKVVANGTTNKDSPAKIDVSWTVHECLEVEKAITINIAKQYLVRLYANGGIRDGDATKDAQFNAFTTIYEFKVDEGDEIDLSNYDKPYIYKDCNYYNFIHYNSDINDTIEITRQNHDKIRPTGNLDLYAFYDTGPDPNGKKPATTLWLTDVDLFHNEEYYQKYNKDKIIYPGASGSYTMNITNETYDYIKITRMTLKEESICVEGGCLNMAYIIRATDPENKNKNFYYYYGNKLKTNPGDDFENDNYRILNAGSLTPNNMAFINFRNANITGQTGSSNKEITINKNKGASITIFWRWIDYDDDGPKDEIDTKIGQLAAKLFAEKKEDLLYKLFVGLEFETSDTCPTP